MSEVNFLGSQNDIKFIWLDFESNGTDPIESRIIEVGVIATGEDLDDEVFAFESMIKDGNLDEIIASIESNSVLKEMHGSNGLLGDLIKVRNGEILAITLEDLDRILYNAVKSHNRKGNKLVLSGSGVGHYDHNVVKQRMPLLSSLIVYYPKDTGHLRRAYFEANGENLVDVNDNKNHRAFQDITDHLNEERAFRTFFRKAKLALDFIGAE